MKIHVLSIDMLGLQKEQHRKSNEVQGKRQKKYKCRNQWKECLSYSEEYEFNGLLSSSLRYRFS